MANEKGFVATSPILAKILKDEHEKISPEKQNKSKEKDQSTSSGTEVGQSSSTNPDHGQNFNIEDLMNKLVNSPRKPGGSLKENENNCHHVEGDLNHSQETATSKVEERNEDLGDQSYKMAWKSDLHGFYQSSRNDGFLNRFHCRDEDESEEDRQHIFGVGSSNHEGGLNDGRFCFVEMHDNSELFRDDESEVKDVSEETVVRNVPIVLIQPPTPSRLSSDPSSSIGSSRPDTPEADSNKIISDRELCLSSGQNEPELSTGVLQEAQVFADNSQRRSQVDGKGENDMVVEERGNEFKEELTEYRIKIKERHRLRESIEERGGPMMEGREEGSEIGQTDSVQELNESENVEDDLNSPDQVNNSLLTSWTEQRMKKEILNADGLGTVIFGHKADSSPTITWGTTSAIEPSGSIQDGNGDTRDDILQTSIGSATDLREILERSLERELESFEKEKDENIGVENLKSTEASNNLELRHRRESLSDKEKTLGRRKSDHVDKNTFPMTPKSFNDTTELYVIEKSDQIKEYVTSRSNLAKNQFDNGGGGNDYYENTSVNEFRAFNRTEDNHGETSLVATISDETVHHRTKSDSRDSGLAQSISKEFEMLLERLEAISLMKSVEVERVQLEAVKGIRGKMEESCNGLPIEKIPSFVYDKWEDFFQLLAEEESANFKEMQTEHESKVKDMKSELDKLTKENFDLSKMAAENKNRSTENELLRRQIGGLEEFVSSLERRIEGRAKENTNLIEEMDELRSVSAKKEIDLKMMVKSYESDLKESRSEIATLKEKLMKLENEIKMKEIENRKISADSEKVKDEMESDFKEVNSNITMLRSKLTDLQNENQTFKTANEADQTIIKHLEAKLQSLSDELKDARNEKSYLLTELEKSKIREADLRKKQYVTEKERSKVVNERDKIIERLRMIQAEKKSIELQLNEKMSSDTKNAEAMLKEIKSLESFLGSVRSEKTHIEDKYNDLRFQLERVKVIENRQKEISETYTPEKIQKNSNTRLLLDPNYLMIPRSSGTDRSLETSETKQSRLSPAGMARSTNFSREDNSNLTFHSTSPVSLPTVNSPGGDFVSAHNTDHKLFEKRFLLNASPSEDFQSLLERKFSSDTSLVSYKKAVLKSHNEAEKLTAQQDSDEGSVCSYSDFPRESASLPSVLVVQTNTSPSRSSDSIAPFKEPRSGYVGNARPAERGHSRLIERETSGMQSGSRDWKLESTNAKQPIGDASSENEDKGLKSNSYSAEDTRLWLRSMETKLEHTDQVLKSMKKSKHVII